jgi:hypothetical protein
MKQNKKMILGEKEKATFKNETNCYICGSSFNPKDATSKVRDHDHRTGEYRGATCRSCNINYYSNRYLPVVFHNLRGYDSHLIIKKTYDIANANIDEDSDDENKQQGKTNISVIPNSYEKFMSFKINDLRFIDSYQFMKESLEKLAVNLYSNTEDKYEKFNCMKTIFGDKTDLLCRKGYYPYEWFDTMDKTIFI